LQVASGREEPEEQGWAEASAVATAAVRGYIHACGDGPANGAGVMSKGMDQKKESKKKPQKSKEEKRAEKRAKQAERSR
jgi:hypothetical protein